MGIDMTDPFKSFEILPSYLGGFTYSWEVVDTFNDPAPWTFTVLLGESPDGPWSPVSSPVKNAFVMTERARRRINKSAVYYFKVRLVTCNGTYESKPAQPYAGPDGRDFLLARELMRRETLHARKLAGTEAALYIRSTFGPKCVKCLDPITGRIRDSHCKSCLGTGRASPYHGPYMSWVLFSSDQAHEKTESQDAGTTEPKSFEVRMAGVPVMKKNDVVLDPKSGKMYYVDSVKSVSEVRRFPVAQTLVVHEAPVTDALYGVLRNGL